MTSSATKQSDTQEPEENDPEEYWTAKAWVYFIWVVMGRQVYCKIGYSKNPGSRIDQIIAGIPEQPYYTHMLPCLSAEQARLFERMFHTHLHSFRSKSDGEWFTDPNAKRLYNAVSNKMDEIFSIFHTFDYEIDLKKVEMDGPLPLLRSDGFISPLTFE